MAGKITENMFLDSCIDADAHAAGTFWGDEIDMQDYHKVVYALSVGDMASSATVDYAVWGCATSAGTFAAITGGSITQLTQAGTDADKQALIEIDAQTVLAAGYRYVKDRLLVGTDAVDACAVGFGFYARYAPETDLASVDEIVVV